MTRTKTPPNSKKKYGKPGPKSKCTPELIEQTEALCKLGLTDWQLAEYFGVAEATLTHWKKNNPVFKNAVQRGRTEADVRVAEALYHRALGYSHPAIQFFKDTVTEREYDDQGNVIKEKSYGRIIQQPYIKQYPPDVKAATKILAVRHRDTWGESWKSEKVLHHRLSGSVEHLHLARDAQYMESLKEFSTEELELISKLGLRKALDVGTTDSISI